MNIEINSNQNLFEALASMCQTKNKKLLQLKPEIGVGEIKYKNLNNGLELFLMEMEFKVPILVNWHFASSSQKSYYLAHNEIINTSNPNKNISSKQSIVEEGVVIFNEQNDRNRLWLPNMKYKVIMIHFSKNWLNDVNNAIKLPKHIYSYIENRNIGLNIKFSSEIKQIINQVFINTSNLNPLTQTTYLQAKCLELMLYSFDLALLNVSTKKLKNTVHPDDMDAIIHFTDNFYKQISSPPKMETVAFDLGMSISKFQRIFKNVIGTNYYKFVLKNRMLKAMELLMNKRPVTEAAFSVGYSTIGNFTHAFKSYFKFLPSEVS